MVAHPPLLHPKHFAPPPLEGEPGCEPGPELPEWSTEEWAQWAAEMGYEEPLDSFGFGPRGAAKGKAKGTGTKGKGFEFGKDKWKGKGKKGDRPDPRRDAKGRFMGCAVLFRIWDFSS